MSHFSVAVFHTEAQPIEEAPEPIAEPAPEEAPETEEA